MAKPFGYERGAINYVIGVLLTVPGFISMYIFGSGIMSVWAGFSTFTREGNPIEAALAYFIAEYLPPTSVGDVFFQAVVGACVAAFLWYIAVPKKGR